MYMWLSWADVKLFTIANKKFASEDLVVEKVLYHNCWFDR